MRMTFLSIRHPHNKQRQIRSLLPIREDDITWANGFGANSYAAKYANPLSNYYNGTYGQSGGIHPGVDFGAPVGSVVIANVSGTVIILSNPFPGDAEPNVVVLLDNGMYVIFGHVIVDKGLRDKQRIIPGFVLGELEDQGANTHLHLAVRDGQRTYNPLNFFEGSSVVAELPWSDYSEGEGLYSMSSYTYTNVYNYWSDDPNTIGVRR